MNTNYLQINDRRKAKLKSRQRNERCRAAKFEGLNPHNQDFICAHCRQFVSAEWIMAGVKNRNHCPYCLWSRHYDHFEPGDRLSACKQPMRPVAVTLKQTRKKYGLAALGELMLVHMCVDCGKISANRIAADDDLEHIYAIFEQSLRLDPQISRDLSEKGARPLAETERDMVSAQLFGKN